MRKHVLIAAACCAFRRGLRAIFLDDPNVAHVYEAATSEELKTQLASNPVDLIVIHQALVTDMRTLPRGHFIILAAEPDKAMLLAAHASSACGYLSENASAELLRTTLYLTEKDFLLDPAFASWILDYLDGSTLPSGTHEKLTLREEEIFALLRSGLTNRSIATQLSIAQSTVKSHVVHIFRKLGIQRRPMKEFSV